MNIVFRVLGHLETQARLLAIAAAVGPGIEGVVRTFGELTATSVKAHASGRPGPNAPTGDYRRSIHPEFEGGGATFKATVGTNKPQGRRLEFGFVGTDSLGRHYNQPPFPHFAPAIEEIQDAFVAALAAVMPK